WRVPKCTNAECGAISIDDDASEQIDKAFRHTAKLLTPSEIRKGRINLGFQQQEFAQCLGIGVSTLSRWETRAQVQQHFHDGILRAFFAVPQLRAFLASLHGVQQVAASSAIPTYEVTFTTSNPEPLTQHDLNTGFVSQWSTIQLKTAAKSVPPTLPVE